MVKVSYALSWNSLLRGSMRQRHRRTCSRTVHALETVETFQAMRMTNKPGRVLPLHASSLGKVITAFQKPALIDRMLEVYGLELGKKDLAVANRVLSPRHQAVAAVSVSTPVIRMRLEREEEITRAVLDAARQAAVEVRSGAVAAALAK